MPLKRGFAPVAFDDLSPPELRHRCLQRYLFWIAVPALSIAGGVAGQVSSQDRREIG